MIHFCMVLWIVKIMTNHLSLIMMGIFPAMMYNDCLITRTMTLSIQWITSYRSRKNQIWFFWEFQLAGTLNSHMVPNRKKSKGTQQGHKMSHNVGTRLLSGFLVSFASGVVKRNCWMKQQSNTQKQGHLWLSKVAVWVLCMGHRAQQHSTGGVCWYSIKNIIWNVLKVMISTRK